MNYEDFCKMLKNELTEKNIKFKFILKESVLNEDISVLDLSTRPYHRLKISGINTMGELIDHINSFSDLMKIEKMGKKSCSEIMKKIMYFQYINTSEEKRKTFIENYIC